MNVPNFASRWQAGLLLASLLLTSTLTSCEPPKGGPGGGAGEKGPPKIKIVGGDSVNWGKVAPGLLKHDVKIINVGGDTLKIIGVHPSCGCTTAPIDKKNIVPGDTAIVSVTMDVTSKSGEQHKSLSIASNDSTRQSVGVVLLANVVREVTVTPDFFPVVDNGKVGVEDTSVVEIKNTGDAPVTIEAPTLPNAPEMVIRFDMTAPRTLAPGEAMRVKAHVKPIKDGTATAEVHFKTSNKNMPDVKVSLTANVHPPLPAGSKSTPQPSLATPSAPGAAPGAAPATPKKGAPKKK
jgi:hypothetical protein